jgi:hypothetical protein
MIATIQKIKSLSLFQRPESFETPKQIIFWWEKRRIPYNLIVGSVGFLTCVLTFCIALYSENKFGEAIGLPDPPIFALLGIILYGIAANFCYTAGWFFELIVKAVWKERARHFGEIAFTLGLFFSVILTLVPAIVFSIVLIVKLFSIPA